jgi:hypothetical protein
VDPTATALLEVAANLLSTAGTKGALPALIESARKTVADGNLRAAVIQLGILKENIVTERGRTLAQSDAELLLLLLSKISTALEPPTAIPTRLAWR